MLDILTALPCMVMVSGYWSKLYADRLAAWHVSQFQAMTRGGKPATEWLWCSFPPPVVLHDYRHLGASFRERERIKRKKQRWSKSPAGDGLPTPSGPRTPATPRTAQPRAAGATAAAWS
ncbi:MAG TPA: hypothetical protein VFY87_22775 [Geminicoccaceae bacterium]|nr:hypothetical protein [Geminicoccaceae bacterium]